MDPACVAALFSFRQCFKYLYSDCSDVGSRCVVSAHVWYLSRYARCLACVSPLQNV